IVLLVGLILRQGSALHDVGQEREELIVRERASREQVTNILESITDAFFALSRDWRLTYVNREAERQLRRPREALLGRSVWDEYPEVAGTVVQHAYERAMRGEAVSFENYYPPLEAWFEVNVFPSSDGL